MKKLVLLGVLFFALSSCRKYPDLELLSDDPIVITNYDNLVNFDNYQTYYISDSLTLINDNPTDTVAPAFLGNQIINTIKSEMASRGFTLVATPATADLAINTAAIAITSTYTYFPPSYWWGYPGYGGCYYGYCNGYYPIFNYPISYSYSTGSLMLQMADLKNISGNKLNMVWINFNNGILGSTLANAEAAKFAIAQAFKQSPYLKTN